MAEEPVNHKEIEASSEVVGGVKKGESRERSLYRMWKAIPSLLRLLPEAEQAKMGYDVDDPIFKKLVGIKTKGQFCREFGVGVNQPTRWEQEPGFLEECNRLATTEHVLRFRKEVDFSFTQKVLRHGDAPRVKLWKQLHEGWREKIQVSNTNINLDVVDFARAVEERNQKLREEAGI